MPPSAPHPLRSTLPEQPPTSGVPACPFLLRLGRRWIRAVCPSLTFDTRVIMNTSRLCSALVFGCGLGLAVGLALAAGQEVSAAGQASSSKLDVDPFDDGVHRALARARRACAVVSAPGYRILWGIQSINRRRFGQDIVCQPVSAHAQPPSSNCALAVTNTQLRAFMV